MENKKVYDEGEEGPGGMFIENTMNKDENELPFGYYNPQTEGKVTWICGKGPEGQIVSVFACDQGDHTEKEAKFLENMEQALFFRDELVKNGWKKIKPPKMNFTMTKNDGTSSKELNRTQKRALEKKLKSISKSLKPPPQ